MIHRHFCLTVFGIAVMSVLGATSGVDAQPEKAKAARAAAAIATAPPTAEEIADLEWMRQHTKPGIPYELDLSHPVQYRYVMTLFRRGGHSAQRAPHLYRLLAAKSQNGPRAEPKLAIVGDGAPQPLTYINSIAATQLPRSYQASGLISVNGGTNTSAISIALLAGHQTYAANSDSQQGQGLYFTVPVSGTVPTSARKTANSTDTTTTAHAVFAYVPRGSNSPITISYRAEDTINPTAGCMQLPNYCVRNSNGLCISGQYQTACTNAVTNTTPIKVCYNRGQAECDYWNPVAHPKDFVFPLQGYVQYDRNIFVNNNQQPKGLVTITLENPTKGGGCYLVPFKELAPLDASWTVLAATPKQLNWNFPAAAFSDPNSCLNFYDGTNTYLHVQVDGLAMQDGTFGQFKFTSNRNQIGNGPYIIPGIQIQQGCFAAGTQIRLADGSLRAIETFTPDQPPVVKSGKGDRVVLGVTSGIEPIPMIRLNTDKGQTILVTRTHPIVTPAGPVMAGDLKVKGKVMTDAGPATLTEVKQEKFDGKVYNIRIGDMDDREIRNMTVQANGFIAGDARMQSYYEEEARKRLKTNPADVLRTLPPEWHEDFHANRRFAR